MSAKGLHKVACGRCGGSGRYDRGACFGCQGTGFRTTTRKPSPRFEVSAIYSDGVRRLLKNKSAASAEKAVKAVLAERDWIGFDLSTIDTKQLNQGSK